MRKRNGLKIAFVNIVSLRKHKHELEIILKENEIDIIGLSETRLDNTISDPMVSIEGFRIFRNDRNANGGGVAIYVKNSIPEPVVKLKSDNLELLSMEIFPGHARPFHLVCWYRPPTSCVDDEAFENLTGVLSGLDEDGKEIMLVGDTNCDFKDSNSANARKLRLIYSEFHLEQMVKDYTRVATTTTVSGEQRTSKTLIDHFATSCPKYIIKADVIKTGMVDHYPVYAIRKVNAWRLNKKEKKIIESRSMRKYEKNLFRNDIQQINWSSILSPFEGDPAGMAATFQDIFESILDIHAPLRKKRVRSEYAPWLSASLKNLMNERDRFKKLAERQPEMWPKYRQMRNRVTKQIRTAIQNYYSWLIKDNEKDPKKMWKTINKLLEKNRNSDFPASLEFGGKRLTKEHDVHEAFNHHSTSIGPKLAANIDERIDDDCLQNITPE